MATKACANLRFRTKIDPDSGKVNVQARRARSVVGELEAVPYRGRLVAAYIFVDADVRRCGVGTRLYELAAKQACKRGVPLVSDVARSAYAEGFWAKQTAKGRARCVKPAASLSKRPPWVVDSTSDDDVPLIGRGGCDHYELACPVTSLAGRVRRLW